MRRREFLGALGGAAAAWPLAARAQQSLMPKVGFFRSTSAADSAHHVAGFREGLREQGFIEGQNVIVEYRFAEHQPERLRPLAEDLLEQRVAVIVANNVAARITRSATASIPIVFTTGFDPVFEGLVTSLNRPSGNLTGVSFFGAALRTKHLEIMRETVPKAAVFAMLVNPKNPNIEAQLRELHEAAGSLGLHIQIEQASNEGEIDAVFPRLAQHRADALLIGADPFLHSRRHQAAGLALRHTLPTISDLREYAAAGGLMSYGNSVADVYRHAGNYAGRILKGDKPTDLPVVRPTKFELVINIKTAKTLGLEVPATLLARADEVIE
jgi:putative ABC transport system substrate-binding protein